MSGEVWLYCYNLSDGEFAGSIIDGVNEYDSTIIGTTSTPVPAYDEMTHCGYWTGTEWEVREI